MGRGSDRSIGRRAVFAFTMTPRLRCGSRTGRRRVNAVRKRSRCVSVKGSLRKIPLRMENANEWMARTVRGMGLLQILIIRPRSTLGRYPSDDFVGVLDVAGLALDAVGRVDLQAFAVAAVGAGFVDDFVDARGAEAGAGVGVFLGAAGDADAGVGDVQVHGLVFVVFGGGEIDAGKPVARGEGAVDVVA